MIRTPRLALRPAWIGDVDDMHAVLSHPRAMRYWSTPAHETRAQTQDWVAAMIAGTNGLDFVIAHEGRVIGKAGLWRLPEIGFILLPDHWGKGLGHEAAAALIAQVFAATDLDALTAEVAPRNHTSRKLLAAVEFIETGFAERTMQWRDEWCDSVYLSLSRATFLRAKG